MLHQSFDTCCIIFIHVRTVVGEAYVVMARPMPSCRCRGRVRANARLVVDQLAGVFSSEMADVIVLSGVVPLDHHLDEVSRSLTEKTRLIYCVDVKKKQRSYAERVRT